MVQDTSSFIKIELGNIGRDMSIVQNVRGNGTFLSFDAPTQRYAESIQSWLNKSGIHIQRCGPKTLAVRPALIMLPRHAAPLRESLTAFNMNHELNDQRDY